MTAAPATSVDPPSMHMPSGLLGVREDTSTRLRFGLYAHFCCPLPSTQVCIWTLVPAAGELEPASRHRSRVVWYVRMFPPGMFSLVMWKA